MNPLLRAIDALVATLADMPNDDDYAFEVYRRLEYRRDTSESLRAQLRRDDAA